MSKKKLSIVFFCFFILVLTGVLVWKWGKINEGQSRKNINDKAVSTSQMQGQDQSVDQVSIEEYVRNWDGDTSSWKTYRNEKFGVEFKYPSEVLYVQDIRDSADVDSIQLIQNTRYGEAIDAPGTMILSLNDFQSEKGYVLETKGKCQPVSIFNGAGNICSEKEHFEQDKAAYSSFTKEGLCTGSFLINFSLPHYSTAYTNLKNPDGRNRLFVSCDLNEPNRIMKIFQGVFRSVSFSSVQE